MTSRLNRLLCSPADAVALIQPGQTVVCGGFVGAAHPESLTAAIEDRFLQTGEPRELTLLYAAGQGNGSTRGLNHLAHRGLVRRVIGGHWGLVPKLGQMAIAGDLEGTICPQGVVCQLLRDIAAGRPGCITHVGLDTFVDPAHGGGRLHPETSERLVERIELDGKTWLFYRAFPVHIGLIRATAADPLGNLVMTEEAVIGEVLPIAQAVHNSGGVVLAQVREILDEPAAPHTVRVPGVLVDRIAVAPPEQHHQTFGEEFNPAYFRPQTKDHITALPSDTPLPLDARRIIAARACDELAPGAIANLGIGMPEGIARIAAERGVLGDVTLTVESGPIGGIPAGGLSFGASAYPEAIIDQPSQFDFYDGGGLDFAALGAAQVDQHGNVNVSKFHDRVAGVGGFINISQNARKLVFCGTLTTGGLSVAVRNGQLVILKEGRHRKFLEQVEQISFSGQLARRSGQDVLFVTERAVFRLTAQGLELTEVAPGIDVDSQILAQMDFRPVIGQAGKMPAHVFSAGPSHS